VEIMALVRVDAFGPTGITPRIAAPERDGAALLVYPNPARSLVIDVGAYGTHAVRVLDLQGMPVAVRAFTGRSMVWEGRDQTGRWVEPGMYCIEVDGVQRTRALITR
jgi:hypothetical protein